MSVTFYDSITAPNIPKDARYAAGYVGGYYQSWFQLATRVPAFACLLKIAVSVSLNGDVLDIEKGDATPAQAPGWCLRQKPRPGWKPIVYCNASTWMSVRQAFIAAGQPEPWYWIASYPSTLPTNPQIPLAWLQLGCILWQYAGSPGTSPGAYDLSISAPSFPKSCVWIPSRKVRHNG